MILWGVQTGVIHQVTFDSTDFIHIANRILDNLGAILSVSDWLCRSVKAEKIIRNCGPPLTMKTLLEALIKAYEIQGCFLIKNAFNALGLDHIILVKLASTAVVSWLMGLSEEETLAAISHVWMDGAALRTYRSGSNTIPRKGWAAGDACMRAVHFALLTRAGQNGAPTVLTMPRWGFYDSVWKSQQFILPQSYDSWCVENLFFKVIPVEGHSISGIEATLQHHAEMVARKINPENEITRIEVRTNGAANLIINKAGILHNSADRDHCMQYSLAVTLMKGDVPSPEDYLDSSLYASSQAIDELRARIHVREDEQFTRDYLDLGKKSVPSGVTIYLKDGSIMNEIVIEYPVGHCKNKATAGEVKRKFWRNMGLMFSEYEIANIVHLVETQENMLISDFVDLLARPQESLPRL